MQDNFARELVDMAQAEPAFDDLGDHVLAVLERAVGFDTGILVRCYGAPHLRSRHVDSEQLHYAHLCRDFAETRYARDLQPVIIRSYQQGGCLTDEAYSANELENTRLYDEVLGPSRVRSAIHLCARWRGQPILRFTLSRHGIQRFDSSALERALRLLPTIEICHASLLRFSATKPWPAQLLSPRELEVARHVARGLTNPQIASLLGTATSTVRNQIARIFDKIKVASRSELAAYMAENEPLYRIGSASTIEELLAL